MDLTQGTEREKIERSKKMMLAFGIAGLTMGFAALTSAYIVSRSREDWGSEMELPISFFISTVVIVLSSLTYILAKRAVQQNKQQQGTLFLIITLILGIAFIVFQYNGFGEMVANGYYFTGDTSTIVASFTYAIAVVHIAHVVAGIISLIVVCVNQMTGKYTSDSMLGLRLGATFWHFLDILWVYLILFMYFVK